MPEGHTIHRLARDEAILRALTVRVEPKVCPSRKKAARLNAAGEG